MKLNKYLFVNILIAIFISGVVNGQVSESENMYGVDEFIIDEYEDMFPPLLPPNSPPPHFEDLSFNWTTNNYNVAFNNAVLIEQVRLSNLWIDNWYDKQFDLIKKNIEDKLGRTFSNFEEAKNAIFLESENTNIIKYTPIARKRHYNFYIGNDNQSKVNIINLKSLEFRKNEIENGNINNSLYPDIKIGNKSLKDIKDLTTLNQLLDTEFSSVEINLLEKHNHYNAYLKTNNLGTSFLSTLLNQKNGYYNGFSKWERLNLMQLFLNYELIKKYLLPPYVLPLQFQKFGGIDKANAVFIENYAMTNRGGDRSIFDGWWIHYFAHQVSNPNGLMYPMTIPIGEQMWKAKKKEAIENLINGTNTSDLEITNLIGELEIDNDYQKKWLFTNKGEAEKLVDFLNANRVNGNISLITKSFAKDFLENIINEMPNARFDRFKELSELIKNDPFVLIKDCIQQKGLNIENYRELFSHKLPNIAKTRLNLLGNGFKDQPLEEGNAAVANVDYYSVEVITNPDLNNDGVPDTDIEVYNGYRANFADLASGSKNNFQFSCNIPFNSSNTADVSWEFIPYSQNDINIWNSSNPLAAIFKIDADSSVPFGSLISDDGAIIISKYTTNYWIGSTIQTPFSKSQPFSGNRQWGYITNNNGKLELFARAVDVARISDRVLKYTPGTNECKEDTYYNIGEATWTNLQHEIKDWINSNGGQAKVIPKTAIRFDKSKLKEMLESNNTIDQINCN